MLSFQTELMALSQVKPQWIRRELGYEKGFCDFFFLQMTFEFDERRKLIEQLQEKVSSLEKKLERNLSGVEHVQELLKEVILHLWTD